MFTFAYAFIPKSVEEQMSFFSKRVNFTQQWSTSNDQQQHMKHHRIGDIFFTHPGFLVPFMLWNRFKLRTTNLAAIFN